MAKFKYHPGDQFGDWTIVGYIGNGRWTAKCKCGKEQDCFISHLSSGKSTKCRDCYAEEQKTSNYFYPAEYHSWSHMKQRCFNKNNDRYHQYGGRGITICQEWESFDTFLADMGTRPKGTSLDRIDVDGNYNKENCRWATYSEQQRNKRMHKEKHCIKKLSEENDISYGVLQTRLHRGWDLDRAITEKINIKSESICAQARDAGLSEHAVLCRVNRGWSLERALSTPVREKDFTIGEKARAKGLSASIVSNRIRKGWSEERALSTPVRKW